MFLLEEEKVERAFSLSIAALLGDGVYNFGELVRTAHLHNCVTIWVLY